MEIFGTGWDRQGLKSVCEYAGEKPQVPTLLSRRFLRPGEAHCRSLPLAGMTRGE
jgi:hypothetical protein